MLASYWSKAYRRTAKKFDCLPSNTSEQWTLLLYGQSRLFLCKVKALLYRVKVLFS